MSEPDDEGDESPRILGLPVVIFVVVIALACVLFILVSLCATIYIRRCLQRQRKRRLRLEQENQEYRNAKKGRFFNPFGNRGNSQFRSNPWTPHVDPATGSTYYVNSMTGESSWDDPRVQSFQDEQGRTYYTNMETRRTSWNYASVQTPPASNQMQVHQGGGVLPQPQKQAPPPQQQRQPPPQQNQPPPQQNQQPPRVTPPPSRSTNGPPPGLGGQQTPQLPAPNAGIGGGNDSGGGGGGNSAKSDPKYAKYARMEKAGLPEGAIRNAMGRDGIDPGNFFD